MKVKQGKIMLLSLIAAFITFFSLSLLNLTATSAHADDATVTQSAVALTQKTYGIDWEELYGKDGYVVIGDASATYYTDMQEGGDGTTAIKDTAWKYTSNSLSSFTPKSDSLITTLTFGTVVWTANKDLQTYNLYKPGTNKTERLKTRAHQNNGQKYYADVFAGFTLKGDSATYVTLNVSDHNRKVSAEYPITISVYVSDRTAANGEAYANNANSDRYQTIDEFYAGKGGSPLATTTVTQQSANVTFKLQGAGEYRIVAYYNNPTAVDENGKMVATGTNSPLCPQINGFFFDIEEPQIEKSFNTTTSGAWEGAYGSDAYVIFTSEDNTNKSNLAYTKGIYIGKDNELISYWRDDTNGDPDKHNPVNYNAESKYSLKGAGENGGFLEETGYLTKYYLASAAWKKKEQRGGDLRKPGTTDLVNFDSGNGTGLESSAFAFEISDSAFVGKKAVYVTVYSSNAFRNANIDADFNVYLYCGYYARSGATTASNNMPLLLKNTITTNARNGFYATFKLTAPGAYSINVEGVDNCSGSKEKHAGASICGVFFDTYVEPTIADVSLTLDGTIGLNFYTKTNNVENAAMKFTYADGSTETIPQPATLTDGYYKFTAKVLPKNYAQKVRAELVSGDTVLDSVEYSVKDYCDYVAANSSDEKLKSLCASLVNYGAAADNYFNESQNEISGATVTTEDVKGYQATAQGTAPEGVKVNEISLIIESETSIRLYITSSDGVAVKVNGIEAQIKTDSSGKYIEITNIAVKDLDKVYEISIGNSYVIKCSALTYVYEVLSRESSEQLKVVAKALYLYNQAANAYFE